MFQGLRTTIYGVNDIEKAKAWYSTVLGTQPYFDQPAYVGFNVGGFELGLSRMPHQVPQARKHIGESRMPMQHGPN
ncbi:hypothetical protein KDW_57270 [Dictyobacter vulcani]|uniref:Glyoxalase/fosfomycin resistance/dioxygenase domain-containing protein n=1 Tax=Dictyobacter vulcani TaxID=2607529 RepID=A0A5J4KUI8_9CHLR|nr:hypothetical protein [Dictyobacter vulcani]GER91565.1 hypothetical protein KDW_57270 [Dictyobacter vulcani]